MRRLHFTLVLCLGVGCHARQVAGPEKTSAREQQQQKAPQKVVKVINSERPVRTTPNQFFDEHEVRKLQAALTKHGEPVAETGKLDGKTEAALARFQKRNNQPATGYPDFDTLKRLDLDAREIYLGKQARDEAAK